jgi:hypothetical protein
LQAECIDVPASAGDAAIAEVQAEKVGVRALIYRSLMTARAPRSRSPWLWLGGSATATPPVPYGTDRNAADQCVLAVENARPGK